MQGVIRLGCVFFATWLFLGVGAALAKAEAQIADVVLERKTSLLKVSFRVKNCFNTEMEEAIWSGVPTTFRFLVVLEEPGFLFTGSRLLNVTLERSIKYDTLKEHFRVRVPEHSSRVRTTPRFREAREWMSRVEDLPLIPLWRLEKGKKYRLSIKAELAKVRLPDFLRYIFFFVSLWDFETDWYRTTFTF